MELIRIKKKKRLLEALKREGILTADGLEELTELTYVVEQLSLHLVSESYIKCWNCKQFEQTGTNTSGNEIGKCKLQKCAVDYPKWQKCDGYEQCGNFR